MNEFDMSYESDEKYMIDRDENRNDFHIGQIYEKKPATTLVCKTCGGYNFIVGQGDYYTAIKCPVCGYECMIHEG
jgi:hypothetical protein